MLTPAYFRPNKLGEGHPVYEHFKKAMGKLDHSVVRCLVRKHTACRQGNCAVKKSVQCHSVCPRKRGKDFDDKLNVYVPGLTKDCHGEGGEKFCEGHYTDEHGEKQSFGAIACGQVAIMA